MKWTLLKAAQEFGVARETIRRGLAENGIQSKKHYATHEIVEALFGDDKKERTRESRARADLLERERAELDKVTMRLDDVNRMINDAFLPIRQRLIALASECANRCNPVDSKLAYDALQRWTDDALASIREKLPQPKAK